MLRVLLINGLCLLLLFSTSLAEERPFEIKKGDTLDNLESPVNFFIAVPYGEITDDYMFDFPKFLLEKYDPQNNYKYPEEDNSLDNDFLGYDMTVDGKHWFGLYSIFTSTLACLTSDERASNLEKMASKGNFWFHEPGISLEPNFVTVRENIRLGLIGPGPRSIIGIHDKIQYLPSRKTLEKIADLLSRVDRYVKWLAENNPEIELYMKWELENYKKLSIKSEKPPPGWEQEIHKEFLEVILDEVEKFGDKINESYAFGGVDAGGFPPMVIYKPLQYKIDKIKKKLSELSIEPKETEALKLLSPPRLDRKSWIKPEKLYRDYGRAFKNRDEREKQKL